MSSNARINVKLFLRAFCLYILVAYFLFGITSFLEAFIEGTVVCVFMVLFTKVYCGKDVGVYWYQSKISTVLNKVKLLDTIEMFVEANKGNIYHRSDNTLFLKFGNRYSVQRLFGYKWVLKRKAFILPCKIKMVISEDSSGSALELHYEDYSGPSRIHGEKFEKFYKEYFKRIDSSLKHWVKESEEKISG